MTSKDEKEIARPERYYDVVCAVIQHDGEILCMRRPLKGSPSTAGKWEFPGGKIEEGETPESALLRELREELDYDVAIERPLMTFNHRYPDFSLSLRAYLCTAEARTFNRKEHIDHCWLPPQQLPLLDWAAADLSLINHLKSL